ncbi:MAG: bacteriohemerythrin [Magnetococcales bacterium]|nr:bacteriohemerythrin [Magnetococcales bacterium]
MDGTLYSSPFCGEPPTILVVDDDPDIRNQCRHKLTKHGYRPVLAEDGHQAILLCQQQLPDLVLMDANMPGMDGFTTATTLASLFPESRLPILMVTGLADEESVNKAFKSGAEDYISKPINWAVLRHRIRAILDHRQMEKALRQSEERFRSLAQSSNDAIITADEEGKILFWNDGAAHYFGYHESEIQNQPLCQLIPERYQHAHRQGLLHVLRTGELKLAGKTLELVGMDREGREFPVEISLSTWLMGKKRFFSAIIRDITARKQLEREREVAMQTRIAISALLETALEPLNMTSQLTVALDILHTLPWWANKAKSSIFLNHEEEKVLKLAVWKGWERDLPHLCSTVAHGVCLCGQAALTRQFLFSNDVLLHEGRNQQVPPHSHYCVPILFRHRLLGMLNIYLPPGHKRNPEEERTLHTIAQTLSTIIERRRMEEDLEQTHTVLKETRLEIIHRLGMASEFRDNDTGMHIVRMSRYAAVLGQAAGLDEERCEVILNAAPMHDVGKIGISDGILLKPGRLTQEEFEIMKTHTAIGAHMLFGHKDEPLKTAHIIALTHHERWDGKGYPHGLSGEEIPLEGRICAICDVFDALISERPYKKAWSVEEAIAELKRCAGQQLDPHLVELFLRKMPEILEIMQEFQDESQSLSVSARDLHGFGAFIQWESRMETGIAEVDNEHRHLMAIVNKLHKTMGTGTSDTPVIEVLRELEDYITFHFANEEALLYSLADPWLKEHRCEHKRMKDNLAKIRQGFHHVSPDGNQPLAQLLRQLLVDHVLTVDKRSLCSSRIDTKKTVTPI